MQIEILYSLIAVLSVSVISLVGIFFLSLNKNILDRIIFFLVSLSVGVLLGDVFLHILPEALSSAKSEMVLAVSVFLGVLVFFVLEKFFRWHHAHSVDENHCDDCHVEEKNSESDTDNSEIGKMVIFGDGIHNLIDGVVITAAFFTNIPLGIATTIAVLFHEIPQEISDFAILLHSGYSRAKALIFNFSSALVSLLGIVVVFFAKDVDGFLVLANAFTAGAFIYIAASDLVPELHKTTEVKKSVVQFLGIVLGFVIMVLFVFFE